MPIQKKSRSATSDTPPTSLSLTATAHIDVSAAAEGATPGLPRFQMLAYTGGPMRISGWKHPVIIDLAGLAIPAQSRPIRFGHDPLAGVGHTDAIRIEQGQLIATGQGQLAVAQQILDRIDLAEYEFAALYYGEDEDAKSAESLRSALEERYPAIDFECHPGGQPHYSFIFSIE